MSHRNALRHAAPNYDETDRRPDLSSVWSLVRRQVHIVLFGVGVGVVAAALYCLVATPRFESGTQILVTKRASNLPARGADSGPSPESPIEEDFLATQMQLLLSEWVVQDALKARGLEQLPSIVQACDDDQDPVEYVIENLHVTRGGEGQSRAAHVINVRFRHSSAEDCAAVLKALVSGYQNSVGAMFEGGLRDAVTLIEQARNDAERRLRKIDEEYKEFRAHTPLLRKGEEVLNLHRSRVEHCEAELDAIRVRRTETDSRLQMIRDAWTDAPQGADSLLKRISLIDTQDVDRIMLLLNVHQGEHRSPAQSAVQAERAQTASTEHEQLLSLCLQEADLQTRYGRDHPKLIRVRERIKHVREFLNARREALRQTEESSRLDSATVARTYVGMLQNDLIDLKRREEQTTMLLEQEQQAANRLVADELREEELTRRRDRTQQLYDVVVDRLRDVNLTKDYGGVVTKMIAPIRVGEPVFPKPILLVVLGAFVGLCLGAVSAVTIDHVSHTFCGDEDIRGTLGLPVLAHVLDLRAPGKVVDRATTAGLDPVLVTHHWPASPQAEIFHRLRTMLNDGCADRQGKLLQITSPAAAEGKTTVAANLAISVARSGKRVLLVDANMRRPRLAEWFGLNQAVGLSSVLAGEVTAAAAAQPTRVDNLAVLASGPRPTSPSDSLACPAFASVLEQARQENDLVIVDSPEVDRFSDAIQIACQVDGTLLTIHPTLSEGPVAVRAREMLSNVRANVLGIVVNANPVRRSRRPDCQSGRLPRDETQSEDFPGKHAAHRAVRAPQELTPRRSSPRNSALVHDTVDPNVVETRT